jgi:hypothetical protein
MCQDRTAELQKSRTQLGAAASKADAERADLDPLIENARKEYQAALEALENDLKAQVDRANANAKR